MAAAPAEVIVTSPGRNFVTLRITTEDGVRQHTTTPPAIGEVLNSVYDYTTLARG
ncbi:hypothetical protein [Streptomyces sp. NPDC001450]